MNGRIHIWFLGFKVWSWGPKSPKPFKKPKLGISYSVWDGEELLEQSIQQIRPVADYINVVWQRLSWHGQECSPDLESVLLHLKAKGLIDEIIYFEPDLSIIPAYNEVAKRNVGLTAAYKAGCTHFMTMDTDEFYDTKQFSDAWHDIIERNLSHTAVNIVAYITPTLRNSEYEDFFVPFIYKIKKHQKLRLACFKYHTPCLVDPTRQMPLRFFHRFCMLGGIVMHHMTCVRKDIYKKVCNSSYSVSERDKQELQNRCQISQSQKTAGIDAGKYIVVKNKFNIHIGE